MRESTFFTVAGVTVITGLLAYAFYFDYKRRNDVDFRKKLRMYTWSLELIDDETHEKCRKRQEAGR
jgi:hypothetical protein